MASGTWACFECERPNATSYGWIVDDRDIRDFGGSYNVMPVNGGVSVLRVRADRVYNLSTVECIAFLPGGRKERAPAGILTIQGIM